MIRHHACETIANPCAHCDGWSVPIPVLSTVQTRTTLGAIWLAVRLNTRQGNPSFSWHRFGKTVQLD